MNPFLAIGLIILAIIAFMYITNNLYHKWIRRFAIKISSKENILGTAVRLLYQLFSNEYANALISILGTIVIAVMIGTNYFDTLFYIFCVIYCVCVVFVAWANQYKKQIVHDNKILNQSLYGINVT